MAPNGVAAIGRAMLCQILPEEYGCSGISKSAQLGYAANRLSIVQPLRRGLWLQYEYEINDEKPPAGVGKVQNNLFFVELFSGF